MSDTMGLWPSHLYLVGRSQMQQKLASDKNGKLRKKNNRMVDWNETTKDWTELANELGGFLTLENYITSSFAIVNMSGKKVSKYKVKLWKSSDLGPIYITSIKLLIFKQHWHWRVWVLHIVAIMFAKEQPSSSTMVMMRQECMGWPGGSCGGGRGKQSQGGRGDNK